MIDARKICCRGIKCLNWCSSFEESDNFLKTWNILKSRSIIFKQKAANSLSGSLKKSAELCQGHYGFGDRKAVIQIIIATKSPFHQRMIRMKTIPITIFVACWIVFNFKRSIDETMFGDSINNCSSLMRFQLIEFSTSL